MEIKAIETRYRGYRFRSRLEARWAVFFDALGVKWEYEKEGYELPSGRYLPDFWLPYGPFGDPEMAGAGFWVEIKPIAPTDREMQLMAELVKGTGHRGYIFVGMPGIHDWGAVVFQHWRGGEPESIPAIAGKVWFGQIMNRAENGSLYFQTSSSGDVGDFVIVGESGREFMRAPLFSPKCREWGADEVFLASYEAQGARFEHGEQG